MALETRRLQLAIDTVIDSPTRAQGRLWPGRTPAACRSMASEVSDAFGTKTRVNAERRLERQLPAQRGAAGRAAQEVRPVQCAAGAGQERPRLSVTPCDGFVCKALPTPILLISVMSGWPTTTSCWRKNHFAVEAIDLQVTTR